MCEKKNDDAIELCTLYQSKIDLRSWRGWERGAACFIVQNQSRAKHFAFPTRHYDLHYAVWRWNSSDLLKQSRGQRRIRARGTFLSCYSPNIYFTWVIRSSKVCHNIWVHQFNIARALLHVFSYLQVTTSVSTLEIHCYPASTSTQKKKIPKATKRNQNIFISKPNKLLRLHFQWSRFDLRFFFCFVCFIAFTESTCFLEINTEGGRPLIKRYYDYECTSLLSLSLSLAFVWLNKMLLKFYCLDIYPSWVRERLLCL